jgi:hypothetical protein
VSRREVEEKTDLSLLLIEVKFFLSLFGWHDCFRKKGSGILRKDKARFQM